MKQSNYQKSKKFGYFHYNLNLFQVEPGSKCAIWGIGCVGLATIMGCKEAGASEIIAVDINSTKEKIAREFGATAFCNPKEYDEPIQNVRKW